MSIVQDLTGSANRLLSRVENILGVAGQTNYRTMTEPDHRQYGKKCSFHLYTNGRMDGPAQAEFVLPINPEELILSRPERVHVTKTLGAPFIDDFGVGIPTLNIRGVTGWRKSMISNLDGRSSFEKLHREIIDQFFDLRKRKLDLSLDPDEVSLIFVNGVDGTAYVVVPADFKLMRSKSRPLLYQYDLQFIVVADRNTISPDAVSRPGNTWLDAVAERFPVLAAGMRWAAGLVPPGMGSFFNRCSDLIGGCQSVLGFLGRGFSVATAVIENVADACEWALNSSRNTRAFIEDLPFSTIVAINHAVSVFSEIRCYMQNSARESWLPDFSGLQGVSDCATTQGIHPGSRAGTGENPFYWVANLRDAAVNANTSGVISFVSDFRMNEYRTGVAMETPIVISDDLDFRLGDLAEAAQTVSNIFELNAVIDLATKVLDSVMFDASYTGGSNSDETLENLAAIDQVRLVTVKEGDSLESIALNELGRAAAWHDIVAANDITVQNPATILLVEGVYQIAVSLGSGENNLVCGGEEMPSGVVPGGVVFLKDSLGKGQWAKVKEITGLTIVFHESFSQRFEGPITLTNYENLANLGVFDSTGSLAADFAAGSAVMSLDLVKNIHVGYQLYLKAPTLTGKFTVKAVRYFEGEVVTEEAAAGTFPAGTEVQIFDTGGRLHVLQEGVQLRIPANKSSSVVQSDVEVLGTDLQLTARGILSVTGGDLGTVSGVENFKQAIRHRIITPYKSLPHHPNYGCGIKKLIGAKNSVGTKNGLVRAMVIESLNREPRAQRISELQTEVTGDAILIAARLDLVQQETLLDLNIIL